jgi:DNA-binding GntR family transcriptional regulator
VTADRQAGPVPPLRHEGIGGVVALLEEDIMFGRLAPGARLTEDALMVRFGASRHFIRQTLVEMERRGVVQRERNVGATVRSYSAEEVRQIYEVREMLTRQAMLMIALPAEPGLIASLDALQDAYRDTVEKRDLRGIHEANDAFHIALFDACGNPYLVRTLTDYMGLTLPMRAKNLADADGLRLSVDQHGTMIELLRGRDRWALAQLAVDHMQASKADYLARIANPESRRAGSSLSSAGRTASAVLARGKPTREPLRVADPAMSAPETSSGFD